MERISLLQVSAVRQSAPDSFVLFFRRSQSCFEPDVNILQPVKEVLVVPSAEFQDLDHHLKQQLIFKTLLGNSSHPLKMLLPGLMPSIE